VTRTEFLNAYCDWKKLQRGHVPAAEEFKAHSQDRNEASGLWRRQKARLQLLTVAEWRKQQEKS